MKRYSYIRFCAAIILLMVGCAKSDLDSSLIDTEREIILFSAIESTKATEMNTDALKEYGKFNVATFKASAATHYYTDVISYTSSVWRGEEERYWPSNDSLNIYAYAPLEDFIKINNSESEEDYSLEYQCPQNIDDQIDLLVKTLKNQTSKGGAIKLEFLHALSSIKFNIEIESQSDVTLNAIYINYTNIEKQRSYNFSTQEWSDSESIYFDSTDGLTTTLTVNKTESASDGTVIFDDIEDMLMIIPQPISSSQSDPHYISIQVAYTPNGAQDETTSIINLPAPDNYDEYKMGECYTYNITINEVAVKIE